MQKQKVWLITGTSRGFGFEITRAVPAPGDSVVATVRSKPGDLSHRLDVRWGLYGSTKFAVEGITEALALEVAALGIHTTVVAPGFFRTDFLDEHSLTRTANVINDYAATVGPCASLRSRVTRNNPAISEKTPQFEKDIEAWYDIVTGTDHDDVQS